MRETSGDTLGAWGEGVAAEYLTNTGYIVLNRNYRCSGGEVDIVAHREDTLVFVEVKTWKSYDSMDLERSIGARKRTRIIRAARAYSYNERVHGDPRIRFDVILVEPDKKVVEHIEHAFTETGC